MYQTERFGLKLFLAALGAGLLAWIIDVLLYNILADRIWRPLLIGLIFLLFALLLSSAILTTSKMVDRVDEEFLFLSGTRMIATGLAITLAAIVLLAITFEAIYKYENTTIYFRTGRVWFYDR